MSRRVSLKLGLNGAFATRRWEDAGTLIRLTREVGFTSLEHCGDILDPFFMGDTAWQLEFCRQTKEAAQREGVEIWDIYTGVATHRFHGLAHSHPAVRRRMVEWLVQSMDLSLALGAARLGGHVDAIPVEKLGDPAVYRAACEELYGEWRGVGELATQRGMRALYWEQMYTPSEIPWTLAQQGEALVALNRDRAGTPIYTTLDVGHCAGQQYGMSGADADFHEWLRRFGIFSEVIHVHQTIPEASAHWPFTPEYNEKGHIRMEEVLAALRESHQGAADPAVASVLAPVSEHRIVLEAIPGSTKCEDLLLEELRISAEYLHQFVPPEGMTWEV